ncbi:hypothetical protein [Pedobacter sp. GR22-6]|uniref:hypothetical protein n=1 Tax=Pedobacter sp. GR22-6 TaxID=3127957 RepID=UPI00307DCB51
MHNFKGLGFTRFNYEALLMVCSTQEKWRFKNVEAPDRIPIFVKYYFGVAYLKEKTVEISEELKQGSP